MNQDMFEWVIVGISAPLAGFALAMYLDDYASIAFIAGGTSLKFVTAYFRTPKNIFTDKGYEGTFEEFTKRLGSFRHQLDQDRPVWRWLSDFATYVTLGGLILFVIELFL